MKLNPKKCILGMKEGVFLGYKVNSDGLMVCPDKVEAALSLPAPKCLKDVQRLNGKLASLISRNGLPANERVDSRIAYDGRATRERRINHLLGSSKRGYQCRPDDRKGREANTHFVSLNFIESIKEARSRVQDLTSGEIVSLNLLSRTRKLGHSTMELRSLIS
ncbi:hypothetical protein Tco_1366511 [Tanacetum coccineum]